ncbi:MAG: hypothetical protein HC902_07805 [Calothrix sp. SM1_5_4]|nr:hypothetical protein [Calothrix sp. SM1_5_4]
MTSDGNVQDCIFVDGFLRGLLARARRKDFSSWRKYTQADLISETSAVAPGSTATVGLRIRLAERWHTYWVNPGDSGSPLRLDFSKSLGLKVSRVLMPTPLRFESGPLISFGYADEVVFPIEIEVDKEAKAGGSIRIEVDAEWLVCEDVCIPAIQTLVREIPVGTLDNVRPTPEFDVLQRARARVPRPIPGPPRFVDHGDESTLLIANWKDAGREFLDFFPFKGSGVTNDRVSLGQASAELGEGLTLKFKRASVPRADPAKVGVLLSRAKSGGGEEAWQFATRAGSSNRGRSMPPSAICGGCWFRPFSGDCF